MKNIIVELEDISRYWKVRDINDGAWSTGITTSQVVLKEADEILEMKKADLI